MPSGGNEAFINQVIDYVRQAFGLPDFPLALGTAIVFEPFDKVGLSN